MNKKQIEFKIERKIDDWLMRGVAVPVAIKDKIKDHVVVTGGAIVSMLLDQKVNDYDIYFDDFDTIAILAKSYGAFFKDNPPNEFRDTFTKEMQLSVTPDKSKNRVFVEFKMKDVPKLIFTPEFCEWIDRMTSYRTIKDLKDPYRPLYMTNSSITLSDETQLITRFIGAPEGIHTNYDFVHCMNYWTKKTGLVLNPAAMESILTKELRYVGSKYPIASLFRIRKFVQRGWSINVGQILKMALQVNELNLENMDTIEDQLIGVDTVLFERLIKEAKYIKESNNANITTINIVKELIDEIF